MVRNSVSTRTLTQLGVQCLTRVYHDPDSVTIAMTLPATPPLSYRELEGAAFQNAGPRSMGSKRAPLVVGDFFDDARLLEQRLGMFCCRSTFLV